MKFPAFLFAIIFSSASGFAQVEQCWYTTLSYPTNQATITEMVYDAEGNGYGVGNDYLTNTAIVARFSRFGEQVWAHPLPFPNKGFGCIEIGPDGSLYIGGGIPYQNDSQGAIVKLDPLTGDPSPTWPDTGKGVGVRATAGPRLKGGNYVDIVLAGGAIFGIRRVGEIGAGIHVHRVELDGTYSNAWVSVDGHPAGNRILPLTPYLGEKLFNDSQGHLYAFLPGSVNNHEVSLAKLTMQTGQLSSTWPDNGFGEGIRRFSNPDGFLIGHDLSVASEGKVVLVGSTRENSDARALAVCLNSSGETLWERSWVGIGSTYFGQIKRNWDSGYLIRGSDQSTGFVVRLTENGEFSPAWGGTTGIRRLLVGTQGLAIDDVGNAWTTSAIAHSDPMPVQAFLFRVGDDGSVLNCLINWDTQRVNGTRQVSLDPLGHIRVMFSNYIPNVETNRSTTIAKFGITETANPTEVAVIEGDLLTGSLSDLLASDDQWFTVMNDAETLAATIEIRTVLAEHLQHPCKITVNWETSAGRPGLVEQLLIYNFGEASAFQPKAGFVASTSDQMHSVAFEAHENEFVSVLGGMRARLTWTPINDEDPTQDGWPLFTDLVSFSIVPN